MGEFKDVVGYLADQTFGALQDAAQMATKGDPGFIQSGTPRSVYGKIVQGAARQACRRYADDPSSVRPGARAKAEESCRPYLDDIAYGEEGSVKNPFKGGQCSTVYRIWAEQYSPITGIWNPSAALGGGAATINGPITSISLTNGGACFSGFGPGQRLGVIATSSFNGGQTLTINQACIDDGPGGVPGYRNLRPVRTDGLDDDCGSPEPEIIDPTAPSSPGSPVERFNPEPNIDIDIGVGINPDGTIDIDFGTGPINIDPWGDGGGSAPGNPSEGDEQEGAATGTAGADNDFGDPPAGERWVGCEVLITTEPPGVGRIPQSVPRDIYYAIEGNVRLKFNGSMGTRYDSPVAIRSKSTFLWESVRGQNPTGVFVNLKPGFSYVVRPYSVPEEN